MLYLVKALILKTFSSPFFIFAKLYRKRQLATKSQEHKCWAPFLLFFIGKINFTRKSGETSKTCSKVKNCLYFRHFAAKPNARIAFSLEQKSKKLLISFICPLMHHLFFYPSTPTVQCTYLLSCVPPVLLHIPCIPPFLHSSFLASILSLILPLLHPSSFHASLLSIIPPLLHPSCPAFFLSCFLPCLASAFSSIPSFLNSSFPASLLS